MKAKHPQAPSFANQMEIEAFLSRPLLARLCSYNRDGTIHVAPIYYLYENDELSFGTQELSRKVKNIKRDNRVTVIIDTDKPILQTVITYGEARLDFEDVIEKRVRILGRYYDSTTEARAFAERLGKAWSTVIIHVRPTRIVTVDYSKPFSID